MEGGPGAREDGRKDGAKSTLRVIILAGNDIFGRNRSIMNQLCIIRLTVLGSDWY